MSFTKMDSSTTPHKQSFQNSFLFVNHNPRNFGKLPDRRAIYSHIQTQNHVRRRQKKLQTPPAPTEVESYCAPESKSASLDSSSEESEESGALIRRRHASINQFQSPILGKGNSDPFNVFPVLVDPKVNDLIVFERDYLESARRAMQFGKTHHMWNTDWHQIILSLHDEATAYGYLSRVAVLISSILKDSTSVEQTLTYKKRCSTLLRARLARTSNIEQCEQRIYHCIFALLTAEIFGSNLIKAKAHAAMLSMLFERHSRSNLPGFDLRLFLNAVYNDVQLSAMSLTHPSFPMGGWVEEQFQPMWREAMNFLPPLSEVGSPGLDLSIDNETLREILTDIRGEYIWLQTVMSNPSASNPATWLSIHSHGELSMGQLLNHYLDFSPSKKSKWNSSLAPPDYPQAYASLAALFWIRSVANIENVPVCSGARIYTAGPTILTRLREILIESEIMPLPQETAKYSRMRLWALHTGAMAEQKELQILGGTPPTPERNWFTKKLAEQARFMDLHSWDEVCEILKGFLYSDQLQPHGSEWVEKAIRTKHEDRIVKVPTSLAG